MKMKKIRVLLAACICSATLLTGCSFSEVTDTVSSTVSNVTDKIFGKTKEITEDKDASENVEKSGLAVDSSVEKPEFTGSIAGSTQMAMGSVYGFACPATVNKGTVTYQWYTNNVNSNGGGTPIEGATNEVITVDTSAPSHRFYYVVATNTVDGKINRSTSDVHEFVVWDIGTWQADEETGAVRYMMIDGKYPANTWFYVDQSFYFIDGSGFRCTGLSTIGNGVYYFNDEGQLQTNTTGPNGEEVDATGRVVSEPQPAEEVTEEQPSEEQPAEEASEEVPQE